ncbi:hypothetical protein EIN_155450 [Entamoeba invadens IP1]|uniref:Uncharacterized protein n=1 Tax=Entamoeba invadens IP1 TaxID=370355 RepID=A0A0A1UCQ0_ENTIV|nr:hypothetical protein EIN_155450 [Entamoeba invadens IP1]ELP91438.1 hypothetical protein EIN_155450 [Entamoeba invadens IP1]|eukprot:XP_004258209.1 hypothetical protein EIN_155450 [Entamoeba invadens IP1]
MTSENINSVFPTFNFHPKPTEASTKTEDILPPISLDPIKKSPVRGGLPSLIDHTDISRKRTSAEVSLENGAPLFNPPTKPEFPLRFGDISKTKKSVSIEKEKKKPKKEKPERKVKLQKKKEKIEPLEKTEKITNEIDNVIKGDEIEITPEQKNVNVEIIPERINKSGVVEEDDILPVSTKLINFLPSSVDEMKNLALKKMIGESDGIVMHVKICEENNLVIPLNRSKVEATYVGAAKDYQKQNIAENWIQELAEQKKKLVAECEYVIPKRFERGYVPIKTISKYSMLKTLFEDRNKGKTESTETTAKNCLDQQNGFELCDSIALNGDTIQDMMMLLKIKPIPDLKMCDVAQNTEWRTYPNPMGNVPNINPKPNNYNSPNQMGGRVYVRPEVIMPRQIPNYQPERSRIFSAYETETMYMPGSYRPRFPYVPNQMGFSSPYY